MRIADCGLRIAGCGSEGITPDNPPPALVPFFLENKGGGLSGRIFMRDFLTKKFSGVSCRRKEGGGGGGGYLEWCLLIEDWGLRIADWGLRITDRELRIEDWGLRIGDWGLRIEDCGLRIEGWGLGIEDWGLRIADCGLRVEDWEFRIELKCALGTATPPQRTAIFFIPKTLNFFEKTSNFSFHP